MRRTEFLRLERRRRETQPRRAGLHLALLLFVLVALLLFWSQLAQRGAACFANLAGPAPTESRPPASPAEQTAPHGPQPPPNANVRVRLAPAKPPAPAAQPPVEAPPTGAAPLPPPPTPAPQP